MDKLPVARVREALGSSDAGLLAEAIERHASDDRPGVVAALEAARRRLDRIRAEQARLAALESWERELWEQGLDLVAGVDEVGRGALAGPVTAAAVVLPRDARLWGLTDSKRLTAAARASLAQSIRACATALAVAHASPGEIDGQGIASATALAMRRALAGLGVGVDHALIDGLAVDVGVACTAIVQGDSRARPIAAASIVAKVVRDALMVELDQQYPGYGLALNKGYGTADHLEALARLGPSPIHRLSFAPCGQPPLF